MKSAIKKTIGFIVSSGLGVFFVLGIIGGAVVTHFFVSTPKAGTLNDKPPAQASIIYDRTGQHVLYELYEDERRKILSHEEIPDLIRKATIAAEDGSFYSHGGFDLKSIVRAFRADIEDQNTSQGASTITQQLARHVYFSREKTLERKLKEIIMAVKIEAAFSKDEILDLYLNNISFGSNAYGIQAASEMFFEKSARDLTLDEVAFLAALPKAPTYFSPYGSHVDELKARKGYVLGRMRDLGLASESDIKNASEIDTFAKIMPQKVEIIAPHFVFYVIEELEKMYDPETIRTGGMKIVTTIDLDIQEKAQDVVSRGAQKNQISHNAENAALVALEPKNGYIRAMVGSRDYFDKTVDGQVNVTVRPRQPGSSFKPIVYAKAFEKGYQPETRLFDVPTNFGPDGTGKEYSPQNYNGQYADLVSMRQALATSLNIPAVKTLYLSGIADSISMAKRLGISTLNQPDRYGLSLVLGGGEVKLLDLTAAFGVFANDGKRFSATGISQITDSNGDIIFESTKEGSRVIDEQVARKINSVLSDNEARAPVFGSRSDLYVPEKMVAAKTGTTQDYRDGWTVGYTSQIAVGVWAGNNDNRAMRAGSAGLYVAAPIWKEFMQEVLKQYSDEQFVGYDPIDSDNMMVTGKIEQNIVYYNNKSGEKLSEKDLKKTKASKVDERHEPVRHSILWYLNKDNPLGEQQPNRYDPMLARWEEALSGKSIDPENKIDFAAQL